MISPELTRASRLRKSAGAAAIVAMLLASTAAAIHLVGPSSGGAGESFSLSVGSTPEATGEGWPVEVVYEVRTRSTPDPSGQWDEYTVSFSATSWADWEYEIMDGATFDGRIGSDNGSCRKLVNGALSVGPACDGPLEPWDLDRRRGQPMGASALIRPLAGVNLDTTTFKGLPDDEVSANYPGVSSAWAGESTVERACNEYDDCIGTTVESVTVVVDPETWVPLDVTIQVDGETVAEVNVVSFHR